MRSYGALPILCKLPQLHPCPTGLWLSTRSASGVCNGITTVAQDGLKFSISLPQSLKCQDYRYVPPCPTDMGMLCQNSAIQPCTMLTDSHLLSHLVIRTTSWGWISPSLSANNSILHPTEKEQGQSTQVVSHSLLLLQNLYGLLITLFPVVQFWKKKMSNGQN